MGARLSLNDRGYFEARGLNVLAFSNWYDGQFSDAKIAGVELIHHETRTATNGDVRLSPTPGQWDRLPDLVERTVDHETATVTTRLAYADLGLHYAIVVQARDGGVTIAVELERPLPPGLAGRAGLNLEFLPAAYFGKGYLADGRPGLLPRYPSGPMAAPGEPAPFAAGRTVVLAPEDAVRRVAVSAAAGAIQLFDGRNTAQNGWYVLRTLLPAGATGRVVEWTLAASTLPGWVRPPVVAHSQAGYHPDQRKVAVIELDPLDAPRAEVRLLRVADDGAPAPCHAAAPEPWGQYLRYSYLTFDFSAVREPGLYLLEYGDTRTTPFPIGPDVYAAAWHPTLDVFFPVQMDHMEVREAYRVWHGAAHLDDARQAPVNHEHFDLYAQGPTTDTPFAPGEHIPGLNVGGWFDAGDFDIRTQTQYAAVLDLVWAWESFRIARDETTVDQARRRVEIHAPDGVPDLLQQIEHGAIGLLAQHRALGRAICGIVEPDLVQYRHLGDAVTKTDNLVYSPLLAEGEGDGTHSGTPDDRWAFTSRSTALNYGSAAALAAAARALRGYRDALADECLATAARVWDEEHGREPALFRHGNTTGGELDEEELRAAVELLLATGEARYGERVQALWPTIDRGFGELAPLAVRALSHLGLSFARKLEARTRAYAGELRRIVAENPFGVPISTAGWAGNSQVARFALTCYALHSAFPALIDREHALRGLGYLLGCHPASDRSLVSGVGAASKTVAYGNNRADFSFIAGGVVPGVLIVKPDFPESKDDWPFFWGQNEYVVDLAAAYLMLVNAVDDVLRA
jgi:endoglucanase